CGRSGGAWAAPFRAGPPRADGSAALLGAAELALQGGALVGAQAPDSARLGDVEPLHDLLGADLADAGERLQQSRDLHLADDVVGLAVGEHLRQGDAAVLQAVLDFRALFSGLSGLLQGRGALLGCEGRKGHAGSPRFSLVRGGRTPAQVSRFRPRSATQSGPSSANRAAIHPINHSLSPLDCAARLNSGLLALHSADASFP